MEIEGNEEVAPAPACFFQAPIPDPYTLPRLGIDAARRLHVAGVYFLLEGEVIRYVGQSHRIGDRVKIHLKDKRRSAATGLAYFPVTGLQERLIWESVWIVILRPSWNSALLLRVANGRLSEIRYVKKGRQGGKGKVDG